jgi:ubiquinone/menaquinone biosynthesis C-methylase UbiE
MHRGAAVLMNRVETALVNSPLRHASQRLYETSTLLRLGGYGDQVRLVIGDVTDLRAALGAEDHSYDAVLDFAIVHHVPDWRAAIAEVVRVLKPGGRFYFDEVTAAALATRGYRWLFDHPTEDRFTGAQFVAELQRQGLTVRGWRTYLRGHYLLGVAERPRSNGGSR